jgi:tRNA threonylcarbamoyladenosine biosynthesis protein TsaB
LNLLLLIDTALENASVGICEDGRLLAVKTNSFQNDHAVWIHTAISTLFKETGRDLSQLSAVAATSGPGSYTGLRVGMATAKGFCYALEIPFITETTLYLTALRVTKEFAAGGYPLPVLICPMIDARRMEVFTMLYNEKIEVVLPPESLILNENSFDDQLRSHNVIFCGNGMPKWKQVCGHPNAVFMDVSHHVEDLAEVAGRKFLESQFADLAYTEPDYFKNFYTGR